METNKKRGLIFRKDYRPEYGLPIVKGQGEGRRNKMEELVEMGFITREQLDSARNYQRKKGCKLGIALMEMGIVTPQIMEKFAERVLKAFY
jgi:hypothetical protein